MRSAWLCLLSLVLASSGAASAATITVDTVEPGINADGMCSLSEAVENANDGGMHADCAAGNDGLDVIELGQGETYLQTEDLQYTIEDDVIINGNGSTLASQQQWPVGLVISNLETTTEINDLTIRDAETAVIAVGAVSLNRCVFTNNTIGVRTILAVLVATDCQFTSNGAGVFEEFSSTHMFVGSIFTGNDIGIEQLSSSGSPSDFSLVRSTVSDNISAGISLGNPDSHLTMRETVVANNDTGISACCSFRISHSTMSGNAVGVDYLSCTSPRFIEASTVSGNQVGLHGPISPAAGGMPIDGRPPTSVVDSTITANGIGIELLGLDIGNSIIGGNDLNCVQAELVSEGFNVASDGSCGLDEPTDVLVSDVMLSELGDFGGPTPVHLPLEGSPAIDIGGECLLTDQRTYLRPVDGDGDGEAQCDCGAVEVGATRPQGPFLPDYDAVE